MSLQNYRKRSPKTRRPGGALIFAAALLLAATAAPAAPKPVLAHYMPWFQSPYSLGATNWGFHWTMNHVDPNRIDPATGRPSLASWYYPAIGPYDSADPAVLEYHVLLMKLAGIDGVIVDWYGPDNYYDYQVNDQRARAMLQYTARAGLTFSLCYEDATVQAEINGGPRNDVSVDASNALAHAQFEMRYAETNYFNRANFLRWQGQPVLLNFGPQYFLAGTQWTSIFSVLNPTNRPAFFTENTRVAPAAVGAFDWPPMHLSRTNADSTRPVLAATDLDRYLDNFDASGRAWPAFVSTAFPRFHDFYAQAGVSPSYGYLPDRAGTTFRETLTRAMTNASAFIQLATWNDYGEGTVIEPTLPGSLPATEYGSANLELIQDLRRQFLEPAFPYHARDLALATRVYHLRGQYAGNGAVAAELDRVFTNIVSGRLTVAGHQLAGLESLRPVICDVTTNNNQVQFSIGGYLAAGARIEISTNLTTWQTAETFAAGTNHLVFNTDMAQPMCRFIKVE